MWASLPTPKVEYVQLYENGPMWATMNLGATSVTDAGKYFWWGDVQGHADGDGFSFNYTNDVIESYGNDEGYVEDGKLVAEKDAATQQLGAAYRMPTKAEFEDLYNKCTWTWKTNYNGVDKANGYLVQGKGEYEDNSIFLPAAGNVYDKELEYVGEYGSYWSSTAHDDSQQLAYCLSFSSDANIGTTIDGRDDGLPIRPVYAPVAQIGETAYASLKDALNNAQDGDVVDLVSNAVTSSYTIAKDLTLRLNGFSISASSSNEDFIEIKEAEVTIDGTTAENGMSDIYCNGKSAIAFAVNSGASVTFKNVNIADDVIFAVYCDGGHAKIESGNFHCLSNAVLATNSDVVISGGTFSSEHDNAIYIENGSVTIADGYKYQGESESLAAGTYTEDIEFAGEVVFDTEKAYAYLVSLIGDKEYVNSEYKIYVDETGVLQYTNMAVVAAFPSNKLEVNGNEYLLTNWMLSSRKMKFVVVDGAIAHVYEMVGEEIHLVYKEPASESELVALIGDNVYENAEWVETISVVDGKVAITDKNEVVTILAENNILTKKEDDYTFANISYSYTFIVVDGKVSEIEYHGYGGVVGTYVKKASTPTAIDTIDANKAQKTIKTIENGRVVIIKNGEKFDLNGRKM